MLRALLLWFARWLLALRYRVRVIGLEDVSRRGRGGILFLPNHPALIDPVIVFTCLHRHFAPRAIADRDQIDSSVLSRWAARLVGIRKLPDIKKYGPAVRPEVEAVFRETCEGLRRGENLVLYPSGHLYRSRYEDLRGNSAVETLLKQVPQVRIVLVRTRGLWGSSFSLAGGQMPDFARNLLRRGLGMFKSLVFFAPRRQVTIELWEPQDFPRAADRHTQNAFMESFYNQDAPPALYVPYSIWERGGPRELPDPQLARLTGDVASIPEPLRQRVLEHLRTVSGLSQIQPEQRLGADLGLDSLARAELLVWLEEEFGFTERDVDTLHTVADVLLAARGEAVITRVTPLPSPPRAWFRQARPRPIRMPAGGNITELFLRQAAATPAKLIAADSLVGTRSYRDLITAILALRPAIQRLPGERIGIMLPASIAANVAWLAVAFAGRTPVLVNWTTGTRNIRHALEMLGVQAVLTAGPLLARVEHQGTDLSPVRERLVPLEELARKVPRTRKLLAWLLARISWRSLRRARIGETAAILLTSGSETLPKAVPLSHANILSNIRDVGEILEIYESDRLIGFLPPFHSFGLTVTMIAPLVLGLPVVYHANPTEAWTIARLVEHYQITLMCGTPTFLAGILRVATGNQLASLRIAVTGAEKCPMRTYQRLAERCPNAVILEGYGVTECSPIISVNRPHDPRPGTIGKVLPSFEWVVVDVDRWQRAPAGTPGMLLVRGPCVFSGYLGEGVESPFVEFEQRLWYKTGDLVVADSDGVLTFCGRLKRFVKLGGEMISLPAIEAALERHYARETDEGPVLAVAATADEQHPELVLFTTLPLERGEVNRLLRNAGLSPLYHISRVERLEALPLLGTGKTDYRALAALLAGSPCSAQGG